MFTLFSPYNSKDFQNFPRGFKNYHEIDDIELTKAKLDDAINLKKEYQSIIDKYTNEIKELDKCIEQYTKEIKEAEKKVNYLDDVQRLFRNKYGHEPYLDTFMKLYDELSKNNNITLKIVKEEKKGYVMLAEAGGLNDCEAMKLKLLKDMFEHINQLIK